MGWRARIGLIYPENGDSDPDYYMMAPPGAAVYFARHRAPPLSAIQINVDDYIADVRRQISQAAERLVPLHCDAVGHACVTDSFIQGPGGDEELRQAISKVVGCPATTGTTSFRVALRALAVTRVAVVTPYDEIRNAVFLDVLKVAGVDVVSLETFRVPEPVRAFYQSFGLCGEAVIRGPQLAYRVGRKADCPQAEAVLIASTNFRTGPMIEPLEHDLGKPVVTANQAVMWHSLRLAGVREAQEGLGRLFRLALPGD